MKYRREIDGLRAIAVLPVIFFHAGFQTFHGGFIGVDIFFVISGYLITSIIMGELEKDRFSIIDFYERRARRILPALFLVMLVTVPFAWLWLLPHEMRDFSQSLIAVSAFSSNVLFWKEANYFDTAAELKPLLHTWSLAVEEQYYLFFPILLMVLWKVGKQAVMPFVLVTLIASLVLAEIGVRTAPTATFYLLPTRAWELLIGAVAALLLRGQQDAGTHAPMGGWLSLAGLGLILASLFTFDKETPFPGLHALIPTLGATLIILFARESNLVGKWLGSRLLVGIGLLSYSAYLWHQPLFAFARSGNTAHPGSFTFAALTLATMALAYLSWRFVEAPFRDRSRIGRSAIFSMAAMGMVMFSALGVHGHLQDGNLGRYTEGVTHYFALKDASDEFVWKLKNAHRHASFDPSKVKILVIGDSNSGDLTNVLAHGPGADQHSLSTLQVSVGCGNLYLPRARFEHFIERDKLKGCTESDDLMSDTTRKLMQEADWVFLASGWRKWEAELFRESYQALTREFGNKFFVFGNKNIDFIPEQHIRAHQNTDFPKLTQRAQAKLEINDTIRAAAGERFIDPYRFLCPTSACETLSENGQLIQYDGFHLTEIGARLFAQRMHEHLPPLYARGTQPEPAMDTSIAGMEGDGP